MHIVVAVPIKSVFVGHLDFLGFCRLWLFHSIGFRCTAPRLAKDAFAGATGGRLLLYKENSSCNGGME